MNSRILSSNEDLLFYLKELESSLRLSDQTELAQRLVKASKFSSGSPSEFLHESYNALLSIEPVSSLLPNDQREELLSVIKQLSSAFRLIGGA